MFETFSECAGYEIQTSTYSGTVNYTISKDEEIYLYGASSSYNRYCVNHDAYDGDNPAIQKIK